MVAGTVIGSCFIINTAMAADAVGGSGTNINQIVNNIAWVPLRTVTVPAQTTDRYCIATCSADAANPYPNGGGNLNRYFFTVSNSANPPFDQAQERTLEFWNQGFVIDNKIKEITTTGGWASTITGQFSAPGYFKIPANKTVPLYCLARKENANTVMVSFTDVSMTAVCTDRVMP